MEKLTALRKRKRFWPFAAAVILLLLTLGAYSVRALVQKQKSQNEDLCPYTVSRGDLVITVNEGGDIKAVNSVDIRSEVEGRTTIINIVSEGTYITKEDVGKGKVLVELDSSKIKEQLSREEIEYASASANLTEAKESYEIQCKQNESDIDAANREVRFARVDLQKYLGDAVASRVVADFETHKDSLSVLVDETSLGGDALQKKRELESSIDLAKEELKQAVNNYDWTKKLFDKEYETRNKLEQDELYVKRSTVNVEKAITALDLFKKYEFPKQAETYFSDYQKTRIKLQMVEAQARSKIAQANAKLKSAEARHSLQKSRFEKAQKQLEVCTIKAKAPGMVVYSSSRNRWRRENEPIKAGVEVHEREDIITLPDMSRLAVETKVHETAVDKVKLDQSVKIQIDAFPDHAFTGKVTKVSHLPDPQWGWLNPDLKVYATEVEIDGTYDFLKPGMSAKAEILVRRLTDVVQIPVQAIVNREEKKYCYRLEDGKPVEQEVETGDFNESNIQITKGLEPGQVICLNPPLERKEKSAKDEKPQHAGKTEVARESSEKSDKAKADQTPVKTETEKSTSEKAPPADSKPQTSAAAPAVSVAEKPNPK